MTDRAQPRKVYELANRHPPAAKCKYGDPFCPCQDGDQCKYEGENPMTPPAQGAPMSAFTDDDDICTGCYNSRQFCDCAERFGEPARPTSSKDHNPADAGDSVSLPKQAPMSAEPFMHKKGCHCFDCHPYTEAQDSQAVRGAAPMSVAQFYEKWSQHGGAGFAHAKQDDWPFRLAEAYAASLLASRDREMAELKVQLAEKG